MRRQLVSSSLVAIAFATACGPYPGTKKTSPASGCVGGLAAAPAPRATEPDTRRREYRSARQAEARENTAVADGLVHAVLSFDPAMSTTKADAFELDASHPATAMVLGIGTANGYYSVRLSVADVLRDGLPVALAAATAPLLKAGASFAASSDDRRAAVRLKMANEQIRQVVAAAGVSGVDVYALLFEDVDAERVKSSPIFGHPDVVADLRPTQCRPAAPIEPAAADAVWREIEMQEPRGDLAPDGSRLTATPEPSS